MRHHHDEQDHAAVRRVIAQLQRARAAQGLSQLALAERMGISQAAVGRFELGTAEPYFWTIQRYARALGVVLEISVTKGDST